ncbi:tRNA methyltransferase, Trm1 like protein, partial [Aduncisulcus paluster]
LRVYIRVFDCSAGVRSVVLRNGLLGQCVGCGCVYRQDLCAISDRKTKKERRDEKRIAREKRRKMNPKWKGESATSDVSAVKDSELQEDKQAEVHKELRPKKDVSISDKEEEADSSSDETKDTFYSQKKSMSILSTTRIVTARASIPTQCALCDSSISMGGPMWLDQLHDKLFVEFCMDLFTEVNREVSLRKKGQNDESKVEEEEEEEEEEKSEDKEKEEDKTSTPFVPNKFLDSLCTLSSLAQIGSHLTIVAEELLHPTPYFFKLDKLFGVLQALTPQKRYMSSALRSLGYQFGPTHVCGDGFKTDAPMEVIYKIVNTFKSVSSVQCSLEGFKNRTIAEKLMSRVGQYSVCDYSQRLFSERCERMKGYDLLPSEERKKAIKKEHVYPIHPMKGTCKCGCDVSAGVVVCRGEKCSDRSAVCLCCDDSSIFCKHGNPHRMALYHRLPSNWGPKKAAVIAWQKRGGETIDGGEAMDGGDVGKRRSSDGEMDGTSDGEKKISHVDE